ncbi:MAG: L,D-transpeptidase family protein [Mariprofundaceae bacterium]
MARRGGVWLCAALCAMAMQAHAASQGGEGDDPRWQRLWQALERGEGAVRELPERDRAVLRAALALKADRPDEALAALKEAEGDDPLAALIEAEAHRREAVAAVREAGDYAHRLKAQRELLARADLSPGLGEADARLHALLDKLDAVEGLPVDVLRLGPDVANVFFVDKARSRLFVYARTEDGGLRRIADEYVVTGRRDGDKRAEGDGRTPNGVYRFVKRLSGRALEARYGPVAFPIDYPNALDRLHGKNGHGIWMHGYPLGQERRPPQDTLGCFALPNDRLLDLARHVRLHHSWVVVGEDLRFGDDAARRALLDSAAAAIESWRRDWSSLDTEAYLGHYHKRFRAGKRDLAAWKRYKRRINAAKHFIEVGVSNLTLVHDPNRWPEGEIVVAEFDQHYRSDNYADETRKRLYLARSDAEAPWRILIEETVKP